MSSAEAIVLVFHNRNDSGPAFRCWNPNVASFRCSLVAILVQVLTRVARSAIAARSRLQQIINPADISRHQWGSVLVKRFIRNVLQRRCVLNLVRRSRWHRYFQLHLLVDKTQKGQRRCPAMPAILTHKDLRVAAMLWGQLSQSCQH